MTIQSKIAIRAPVLSPADERKASAWQVRTRPSLSHAHTLIVNVLVLLKDGVPPSATTTGK